MTRAGFGPGDRALFNSLVVVFTDVDNLTLLISFHCFKLTYEWTRVMNRETTKEYKNLKKANTAAVKYKKITKRLLKHVGVAKYLR